MAHFAGLVAAGLHPNPVEYADIVTTTTHKHYVVLVAYDSLQEKYAKAIDKSYLPWHSRWSFDACNRC